MNTRVLGSILIIGSMTIFVNDLRNTTLADPTSTIALMVWCIGGVCGLIGLIRLNALGSNAVSRALGFLPVLGFLTIIVADSLRLAGYSILGDRLNNVLAAVGWLLVLGGMLIVGILTIAAKNWKGWRRFVPLMAVIMAPISLAIQGAIGDSVFTSILTYSFWILLGFIIASAPVHSSLSSNMSPQHP